MKSMIVLTTALFLVSAPSPDSKSISEFSAGFLAETNNIGLMASETAAVRTDRADFSDRNKATGKPKLQDQLVSTTVTD